MDSKTDTVADALNTGAHAAQATGNFGGYLLGLGLAAIAVLVAIAQRRRKAR